VAAHTTPDCVKCKCVHCARGHKQTGCKRHSKEEGSGIPAPEDDAPEPPQALEVQRGDVRVENRELQPKEILFSPGWRCYFFTQQLA